MKTSKLIKILQKRLEQEGDLQVRYIEDKNNKVYDDELFGCPVEFVHTHSIKKYIGGIEQPDNGHIYFMLSASERAG